METKMDNPRYKHQVQPVQWITDTDLAKELDSLNEDQGWEVVCELRRSNDKSPKGVPSNIDFLMRRRMDADDTKGLD